MTTVGEPVTTSPLPSETRLKMSYADFLAWAGEDVHAEWVNGEVFVYMTASSLHQRLVVFLTWLLQGYVNNLDLGEVFTGPMQTKLSPEGSGREPDVFFVAAQNLGRVSEMKLDGPPDLVIEVVSDESTSRDRVDKFEEYEEAGVREYWIIDPRPRRRRADFYQLGPDGKYQPVPTAPEGIYRSQVLPGFWLRVDWLWQEPLPKLSPTLEEIKRSA